MRGQSDKANPMTATELADIIAFHIKDGQVFDPANDTVVVNRTLLRNAEAALRAIPSQQADDWLVEVWRGERKVTVYDTEVIRVWGTDIEDEMSSEPRSLTTVQDALDWLYTTPPAPEGEGATSSDGSPATATIADRPSATGKLERDPSEAPSPAGTASGGVEASEEMIKAATDAMLLARKPNHPSITDEKWVTSHGSRYLYKKMARVALKAALTATPVPQPAPEVVDEEIRAAIAFGVGSVYGPSSDWEVAEMVKAIEEACADYFIQRSARTASAGRAE